jgi:hypothetical protein
MRRIACWLVIPGVVFLAGCAQTERAIQKPGTAASRASAGPASPGSASASAPAAAPENALVGKVVMVNTRSRFAVLNFPIGQMPAADQRLHVYRGGLKVGEVKVGGWQRDDNIVADILAGDCQIGDEVWDR